MTTQTQVRIKDKMVKEPSKIKVTKQDLNSDDDFGTHVFMIRVADVIMGEEISPILPSWILTEVQPLEQLSTMIGLCKRSTVSANISHIHRDNHRHLQYIIP